MLPNNLQKYAYQLEPTLTSYIEVTTRVCEELSFYESKLGGQPYWVGDKPYPYLDRAPAQLIAQINFSQLAEKGLTLTNFPTQGILQFFAPSGDDMVGLRFGKEHSQIKVVYHENIQQNIYSNNEIEEVNLDCEGLPFDEPLKLNFSLGEEYLGFGDQMAQNRFNLDLYNQMTDEEQQQYWNIADNAGSKIGGYAYFTQDDPRKDKKLILLLQIDTDDNLMWGDSGIANWFITEQDLINKNFDNVFFSWDCC